MSQDNGSEPNQTQKQVETISIIFNKKNDSPKYFEISKNRILIFVIGLPFVTLISLCLGIIGLIHTSPFHLIENYKQNSMARESQNKSTQLSQSLQKMTEEKNQLENKFNELNDLCKKDKPLTDSEIKNSSNSKPETASVISKVEKCPPSQNGTIATAQSGSTGLASLSLFQPIASQRDKTKPAALNLSGFKVVSNRETLNFQFNIIPSNINEGKLAGHIIVALKNDQLIEFYPQQVLSSLNSQISFSSGEPFATQRFRPVDASFMKPKKSGNAVFTVYIFAKNGDLIHSQSVTMQVKI